MKRDRELLQILCPFGEWPHKKGLQIVDEQSAEMMKRNVPWLPMSGIPIYIGHPDDGKQCGKTAAVGRVKKICSTKDGVVVVAAYPQEIFAKIINGEYTAMSPRWQMQPLGDGKFRPVKLISIGLTNNPNIESSGKILKVSDNSENLKPVLRREAEIKKRLSRYVKSADECAAGVSKLAAEIRSLKISERIAARKSREGGGSTAEEIPLSRLGEMAKERSARLGEPYTKSFAALKNSHFKRK